jgi:Fic family protein
MDAGSNHVIRSRTEVVQHAAAFHHLVSSFVTDDKPMSEDLIKATHAILVKDIGRGTAGFLSNKEHGGLYRTENVYVGAKQLPKPSTIPIAMQSMVRKLETDLVEAREKKYLDPFALAAEYCDRLVNIHPFRDGNGRMCRLILNAILIKYAGIVVNVGEHDQSRDEYIAVAQESHEVGGHAGALSTMVLAEAKKTLKRMKNKLTIKKEI